MAEIGFAPDFGMNEGLEELSDNEDITEEKLAIQCEKMNKDEERIRFFRSINKNCLQTLELYCPAILVLSQHIEIDEFRGELEQFLVKGLSNEKSKLLRKTCAYALKTHFFPPDNSVVREYFVLLASLEESQFHVVQPTLDKLSALADRVNSVLKWEHIRVCFIKALRHVNGWIRSTTILRVMKLDFNLFIDDYEFVVNVFFDALNQYDIYWRVDELVGIDIFLEDLRRFIGQFKTSSFYIQFLDFFAYNIFPTSMFFISYCLPLKFNPVLDVKDLPLARRVLINLIRIQYPKLRYNIILNFFTLFINLFAVDDVKAFSPLLGIIPIEIRLYANEALKAKFDQIIDISDETQVSSERTEFGADDLPQLYEDILTESNSMLKSITVLVNLIPKVNNEQKIDIVNKIKIAYYDSKKGLLLTSLCPFYVDALLTTFELNPSDNLKDLFNLLDSGERNPQIGFIIARQISRSSIISTKFYPLLLDLAIYGEIPQKIDEVIGMAHERACSFNLDEITEQYLIRGRTRELAITKLLSLCILQKDSIDGLIIFILEKYREICNLFKNRSFGLSIWHRKQTRLMSLLLVFVVKMELFEHITKETRNQIRDFCIERISGIDQQHSLRLIYEWILTLYCMRDAEFYHFWLGQATTLATKRIGSVSSWISIILRSLRFDSEQTRQRLNTFLIKLLPWTTNQNFVVRVLSLSAIKILCIWHRQIIADSPSMQFAIEVADFDADVAGNSRKLVISMCSEPYFQQMIPTHIDLKLAFYGLPKIVGIPKDELIFKTKPNDAVLQQVGLLNFAEYDYNQLSVFATVSNSTISKPKLFSKELKGDEDVDFEVQQKIDTIEMQFNAKKELNHQKELIIVASFINKPANLGGLSRTCEIFNAKCLTVSHAEIIDTSEFKALSMQSHKILPIIEVRPEDVLQYLKNCRSKGFSIVAAEQTSRSVSLDKFQFPEKCVLLLGEEKCGVPPELIRYVDHTVEITQLGQTRSLNVHVTASLFIYNYAVQHLLSSK